MKTISPITWPGGKAKHFAKIKQFFPKEMPLFIEPFCGGASVGLNVINQKLANIVIFNDLDFELIHFWRHINKIDIEKIVKLAYPNVKTIKELEKKIIIENLDINNAELFFIKNALTFNGQQWGTYTDLRLKQNFNLNKIKKLTKVRDLLNKFYQPQTSHYWFNNHDYKSIINVFATDERAVWYLDPPYFYNKGKPYKHGKIDFKELKEHILRIKGKWILSIDNSPEIKELFKDFYIHEFEWFYSSSNCHKRKPKLGKELIVTNFKKVGN